MRILSIVLMFLASTAAAQQAKPPADAVRVQNFLDRAQPACRSAPATACVDAGLLFAASHPKHGLTVSDLKTLRERLGAWYGWHQATLRERERLSIGLALLLADGIGAERLHGMFDEDGNGTVTRSELLADVTLDRRPLGKILSDPKAVDRAALARRLGLPLAIVNGLFR